MQKRLEKKLLKLLILGLIVIAKSLFWFSKLTHLGSGTSLPGLLVEKFCPFIIKEITQDFEQIILISGTNGKTTTRALLVHIWENQAFEVCTNRGGANILRGIAATLLLNQKILGGTKSQIAILEVEEATLPILTKYLVPNQLILTNIFRDQLDAYGEIDQTLRYFSQSIDQIQKKQNLLIPANFEQNPAVSNENLVSNSISNLSEQNSRDYLPNYLQNGNYNQTLQKDKNQTKKSKNATSANFGDKTLQNWTKLRQNLTKKFQFQKEKTKNNSQNNSSKSENIRQNKGFQGFFGRQFPSQNIYESGFDNAKNSTKGFDNPIFEDLDDKNDFNKFPVDQKKADIKTQNDLGNETQTNQKNQLFVQNSETNSQESEQIETQNQNSQNYSKIRKISSLKIGQSQEKNSQNLQVYLDSNQNLDSALNSFNSQKETQIIVNLDDSKLLECLVDCHLPIIGFGIATDFQNKPTFEKSENSILPIFESKFVAQSIGIRSQISRFVVPIQDTELSIETNLTGFFNLYNTVAAIASSYEVFGKKIAPSIASFQPVFGRGEIINLQESQISLYLVKNPAGFEQILDLITTNQENNQISLYQKNSTNPANSINSNIAKTSKLNLGFLINDKIADGKDLSWLWDTDFEKFGKNIQATQIMTSGTRGADLLLRLEQAGFSVKTENYYKNMDQFLSKIEKSQENWIICATYTAMMEFRGKLGQKTKLKKIGESGF